MPPIGNFIRDLFSSRKRSLAELTDAEAVEIDGEVASENTVQSPVTPVKAVILTAALLEEQRYSGAGGSDIVKLGPGSEIISCEVIATVQLNSAFVIATEHGRVLVPQKVVVKYQTSLGQNPISFSTAPEIFRDALARASDTTVKYYNEAFLCQGDPVTLRATVRPNDKDQGPYRGGAAPAADFVVVAEAELPVLIERAPS